MPPPSLTTEQLGREHASDPKQFVKKYKNAPLIVTGVITETKSFEVDPKDPVSLLIAGTLEVFLDGGGEEKVNCLFPNHASVPLSESQKRALKPGQKIKVFGVFIGDGLTDCILLDPAP